MLRFYNFIPRRKKKNPGLALAVCCVALGGETKNEVNEI